ncbi:MAG: DUF433 domain-containing protein [Coprothermobacterota bacterium]|nr:DUF433 domain-containing protein [Coprothermobacterota bacterium]
METKDRIQTNLEVMAGKPVISGTRISIDLIVRMLAQGISEQAILDEYPRLQLADIRAALDYAAKILSQEVVLPLFASTH